tara:strand:+ start:42 stop:242 length:201 start_codon:yes stop_codon:yes gene_type:complete
MKYEEMQKLERFDRDTGKFEVMETLDEISAYHILSVFSAEEKIYVRRLETEYWLNNANGVPHIEFD